MTKLRMKLLDLELEGTHKEVCLLEEFENRIEISFPDRLGKLLENKTVNVILE